MQSHAATFKELQPLCKTCLSLFPGREAIPEIFAMTDKYSLI